MKLPELVCQLWKIHFLVMFSPSSNPNKSLEGLMVAHARVGYIK